MIDGHVHAFPDAAWGRSWQSEAGFEPHRDGTLRDLVARMESASIEAAVLLLFARPGRRGRGEAAPAIRALNRWGLDAAGRDPRLLPFIGVDPNALSPDEVVAEIRAGAGAGARGVKLVPPQMRLYADDPLLEPVFATCVELALPVLSQSGVGGTAPPGPRGPYGRPSAWDRVLRRFPELRLVLAHLGRGLEHELVELVRAHENVMTDTSLRLGGPHEPWRHAAAAGLVDLLRRVGAERVLFGTNYPLTDPVEYVERFRALPLTDRERELIGRGNAVRLVASSAGGLAGLSGPDRSAGS